MAKAGTGAGEAQPCKDPKMDKVVKAAEKIAAEERTGLLAAQVKEKVFGVRPGQFASGNGQEARTEDVQMQA